MLNVAFDLVLSTVFVKSKLKFIAVTKITKTSSFRSLFVLICSTFDKKLIVLHHGDW